MIVMIAGRPFLLDIRDLAVGGDLAIAAGHTPAGQIREAEETHKTHHPNFPFSENELVTASEQILYRMTLRSVRACLERETTHGDESNIDARCVTIELRRPSDWIARRGACDYATVLTLLRRISSRALRRARR
jgi:hypothetical protein